MKKKFDIKEHIEDIYENARTAMQKQTDFSKYELKKVTVQGKLVSCEVVSEERFVRIQLSTTTVEPCLWCSFGRKNTKGDSVITREIDFTPESAEVFTNLLNMMFRELRGENKDDRCDNEGEV